MEEFGSRFNTSKGTVNNWEKGRNLPNKRNLEKIAELGEITVEELINGKVKPFNIETLINQLNGDISNIQKDIEDYERFRGNMSFQIDGSRSAQTSLFDELIGESKQTVSRLQQIIEQVRIPSQAFYIYGGYVYRAMDKQAITEDSVKFDVTRYDIVKVSDTGDRTIDMLPPEDKKEFAGIIRKYYGDEYKIEVEALPLPTGGYKVNDDMAKPVNEIQVISDKPQQSALLANLKDEAL
jgi:transcriptional regulator with XRE-family HTH domain